MPQRSPLPQHPSQTTQASHIHPHHPPPPPAGAATTAATAGPQLPSLSRNTSNSGYFPLHQPTPQYLPEPINIDEETLSNTLANSQIASPGSETIRSPSRQPKFTEEWDASVRGSSIVDGPAYHPNMQRSASISSRPEVLNTGDGTTTGGISLSRGNTLKKKGSLRRSSSRTGSIMRSSSRRSMKAGSVRSLALQSSHEPDEASSAFYCPIPTTGNPTEVLCNRFQLWRKILKDLIAYFREIQSHYEHRSKSLLKLANVLNNTQTPPGFLSSGGLDDALQILRNYHKTAIVEANKARDIEEDVILALTGLRSDLGQKMKEIKGLSGDFKNSVEKEMDNTRRQVNVLQDTLGQADLDSSLTTGKQDPYLLKLAVDRQVERQIDEENYLHQAYLNLEASGRELESIVVGELQKSYNAYAGILKRESDAAYNAIDELRVGPIAMPKDHEWTHFVQKDQQFIDPEIPVRSAEQIHYPGRDHYACQEIRAGLLERKSKYLKSYTAGWYVLSPTHLHEFKSADKSGAPIMSLYLPEQKVGSHSTEGGSSNKFVLKGRQTGSMHRGHTWVFRAESHDTMIAWYEDIKALTEKSPEERSNFVRGHVRSLSRSSQRSFSSDGMNEEDEEPFVSQENAAAVMASPGSRHDSVQRPAPGGRFPSDLQINAQRGMQVPLSPSSQSSGFFEHNSEFAMRGGSGGMTNGDRSSDYEAIAAAGALPGSGVGDDYKGHRPSQLDADRGYGSRASHLNVGQNYGNTPSIINMNSAPSHAEILHQQAAQDGVNPYSGEPVHPQHNDSHRSSAAPIIVAGAPAYHNQDRSTSQQPGSIAKSQEFSESSPYAGQSAPAQHQEYSEPLSYTGQVTSGPAVATIDHGTPDFGALKNEATQTTDSSTGDGFVTHGSGVPNVNGSARPTASRRMDSTPHVPGEYPRHLLAQTPNVV